jgi:hypothetical protein
MGFGSLIEKVRLDKASRTHSSASDRKGIIDKNLTESVVASHGKSGLLALPYPELTLIRKVAERLISIPLHNLDVKCLLAYTVFIKPRCYIPTGVMRKKRL